METTRDHAWRALPFVAAMLLTLLIPFSDAQALFGRGGAETASEPGAPIAKNQEIRAYRGVAYTGTLEAVDNEGGALSFAVTEQPGKGALELSEEGLFVYTPGQNKAGKDSFTFTATDEEGHVSAPARVSIRISRTESGVHYSDTDGSAAATAAVDLAERGVFVGAKVGDEYFFEPERSVTRGEFITMAMAAAGLEGADVSVTGFCDDASIPAWARGYAAAALRSGILRGVSTAEGVACRATDDMTLEQAAAMLNRILDVTDVDLGIDVEEPAWCAQAVANLESVSIVPSGGFARAQMQKPLSRAEAAELLSAAMTLLDARQSGASGLFS